MNARDSASFARSSRSARQRTVHRLRAEESLAIDAALSADGATLALVDEIEHAGPYGPGHPQPVFALPRHRVADVRTVGTGHLRVDFRSETGARLEAIAFGASGTPLGDYLFANRGATVHAAGQIGSNYWNGNRRVQFRLLDVDCGLN